jgi:hypothetical protein
MRKGDIMPYDWWRAMENFFTNIKESGLIYRISEATLGAFVKDRAPELHPYVMEHFPTVWNWVRDNFF